MLVPIYHNAPRRDWGTSKRVDSSWNVMAQGDARGGKWRGNWRMEWVASTLHTTSQHRVSSITTTDALTSAAGSRLNWRPRWFKWNSSVSPKDEVWFLPVCHHISACPYSSRNSRLSSRIVCAFPTVFCVCVKWSSYTLRGCLEKVIRRMQGENEARLPSHNFYLVLKCL